MLRIWLLLTLADSISKLMLAPAAEWEEERLWDEALGCERKGHILWIFSVNLSRVLYTEISLQRNVKFVQLC